MRGACELDLARDSASSLAYLSVYFADRHDSRDRARLVLRYPLMSAFQGISIGRPVTSALRDNRISLAAGSSSWLPKFSGTFATIPGGRSDCRLTLDGTYLAPKSLFGRAFDAIAGVHVARASVAGLLREAAPAIEDNYTIQMAM